MSYFLHKRLLPGRFSQGKGAFQHRAGKLQNTANSAAFRTLFTLSKEIPGKRAAVSQKQARPPSKSCTPASALVTHQKPPSDLSEDLGPRPAGQHWRSCFTCKKASGDGSASSAAALSQTRLPGAGILLWPAETGPRQHPVGPVCPSHRFGHLRQEERSSAVLREGETKPQRSSLIICLLYFYLSQALTLLKPCTYTSVLHR